MSNCEVCGNPTKSKYGICQNNPECYRAYRRKLYATNPEYSARACARANARLKNKYDEIITYQAGWRKRNPVKSALYQAKGRAKREGIPFDLTMETVPPVPEFCPALGIRLSFGCGKNGKATPNSPTLDKIIPELGYVKGNVQWLSYKANIMKNNATPDELRLFAEWIMAA